MTIHEKVAAALRKRDYDDHFYEVSDEDYSTYADIAINAVLAATAEKGWHMRPDEAGPDMYDAGRAVLDNENGHMGDVYLAMLADPTAQFEWDE